MMGGGTIKMLKTLKVRQPTPTSYAKSKSVANTNTNLLILITIPNAMRVQIEYGIDEDTSTYVAEPGVKEEMLSFDKRVLMPFLVTCRAVPCRAVPWCAVPCRGVP